MSGTYDVLNTLYLRAKDHMTADDLRKIGNTLTDDAVGLARQMSVVAGGLAAMMASDAERDTCTIATMLYALTDQFDTIAAMVEVGSEATFRAGELKKAAATKA